MPTSATATRPVIRGSVTNCLIVIVNGFGQASRLVADVLLARGVSEIAVEDPGSVGLRDHLTRTGLNCRPIPDDDAGIRVDRLAESGLRAVVVTRPTSFQPAL